MSAIDIQNQLQELQTERAMGSTDELENEIEMTRQFYVMTAVTEIATLRAELFGAQRG